MVQLSNTFFKRESTSIKFQKESEVCYCILSRIPITVEFFYNYRDCCRNHSPEQHS